MTSVQFRIPTFPIIAGIPIIYLHNEMTELNLYIF